MMCVFRPSIILARWRYLTIKHLNERICKLGGSDAMAIVPLVVLNIDTLLK